MLGIGKRREGKEYGVGSPQWYGEERWAQYIEEILVPFCDGHPATFIVDSSPFHLTDLRVDTAV